YQIGDFHFRRGISMDQALAVVIFGVPPVVIYLNIAAVRELLSVTHFITLEAIIVVAAYIIIDKVNLKGLSFLQFIIALFSWVFETKHTLLDQPVEAFD